MSLPKTIKYFLQDMMHLKKVKNSWKWWFSGINFQIIIIELEIPQFYRFKLRF